MIKNSAIHQQQQYPVEENMSNLTSASNEASVSSSNFNDNGGMFSTQYNFPPPLNQPQSQPQQVKKKRNQPGHPDPDAEVIALSPRTLMATNRFVCEICNKGFQRDQNLQLHRRGHNLPWKLKQRTNKEIRKKVYVCPETSCVHHDPSRALGDLTGIKKHFCRKHGEKKWKCEKCSKKYAVQSDWKAHSKTCGTREYRCDCGTLFSRRDSFITHRAFCDALAEENARSNTTTTNIPLQTPQNSSPSLSHHINLQQIQSQFTINPNHDQHQLPFQIKKEQQSFTLTRPDHQIPPWLSSFQPITIGSTLGPPTPPIDLTTTPSSPSIFQDFQPNQDFQQNPPNPNPSMGPTTYSHPLPPPSPHISATALLQKAAQMGAKSSQSSPAGVFIRPHHHQAGPHVSAFGLNLSSRDQLISGLSSYGNKAATVTGGGTTAINGGTHPNPNPSSLFHDMMMSNHGFDQGPSSFDDMASFGHGFLNNNQGSSKKDEERLDFDEALDEFSTRNEGINEGGGIINDGMTRDFLGLRPLSQSDILSIAALSNCMNDDNQAQKSWQG